MNIIDLALNRSRTTLLTLVLIFITGFYSYITIPKESNPDIPIPTIYVSLHHDGISPEDSVNLLIKPMEKELKSIEGLDELRATAYEGGGSVTLKFQAGLDSEKALTDVREAVDLAKAELPDDADEPNVHEINLAKLPILNIILSGSVPEKQLKQIAEDLQDSLETIPSVLEAPVNGLREEQVLIEIEKAKLEAFDIPPATLAQVVNNANVLVAAGSLETESGKYAIKLPGLFRTLDEFLRLPLLTENNQTVTINDIATVKLNFKDPQSLTRTNGEKTIIVEVSKRIGENVIETVDQAKALVAKESANWPEGVVYSFTGDESRSIRTMLYDLQNSVILSIMLVMIIILAALGPRSALLVATAIPGSFLMAMAVLNATGLTMNTVVLFALILSVGMLVDGAIVVTELADKRMREGHSRQHAFSEAAKYMAMPIIASTLTTLAAFMPLLFWPGIVGEFMKFMPLTLIYTLTASLIMALVFLPFIGANAGKRPTEFSQDVFEGIAEKYSSIVNWCIDRSGKVLIATVAGFFAMILLYGVAGKGVEFFPESEAERANILIRAKGDYSFAEKERIMRIVEERVGYVEDVENMFFLTQGSAGRQRAGQEDIIGKVFVQPVEFHDRDRGAEAVYDEVEQKIGKIAGVTIEQELEQGGPREGKPIKVAIKGDHPRVVMEIAGRIKDHLSSIDGTKNVTDSRPDAGIEWQLDVNREEVAKAGLTLREVGTMVRLTTTGAILGKYRPSDRNDELDIVARLDEADRTFDTIDDMTISTQYGRAPMSNFVERSAHQKVTTIERLDQKTVIYVEADIEEGSGALANDIVKAMQAEVEARSHEIPRGISIEFKGDNEKQAESSQFLSKAFAVALFVMAMILVTQFNSFYQAFIILSAVVLSTMGVLLGHIVMMKPFGIVMSGLGVIALAGIVVNNNIVLIDTYNKLKREFSWREALVETGKRRLRPVLLTAITTVIGLLPMGLKINVDMIAREVSYNAPSSRWWDQLANSIMFGLLFATILTLIVTPCMIALAERRKERKAQGKNQTDTL